MANPMIKIIIKIVLRAFLSLDPCRCLDLTVNVLISINHTFINVKGKVIFVPEIDILFVNNFSTSRNFL